MTMSRHNISDQQTSQKIKQPEMVAPFVTFHVGHDSVLNMLNVHMYVAPKEGGGRALGGLRDKCGAPHYEASKGGRALGGLSGITSKVWCPHCKASAPMNQAFGSLHEFLYQLHFI